MEGAREQQLLEAAERGDLKAVKALVDDIVNINCADRSGWTPIIHAAFGHHLGISTIIPINLPICQFL